MIKTRTILANEDVITDDIHDTMLTWFEDNVETIEFYDVEREFLEDGSYILIREWPDEATAKKYIDLHKDLFKDLSGYISTEIIS